MVFRTHLSLEECRTRLVERTDPDGLVLPSSGHRYGYYYKPMLGKIRATTFRLRKRYYESKNGFAPHFYGRLLESANGTTIEGKFQMHPFARALWAFPVLTIAGSLLAPRPEPCATAFVAAILAAIPAVGRLFGRGDKEIIIAFLKSELEAKEDLQGTGT